MLKIVNNTLNTYLGDLIMADKKEQKLTFLKDAFWTQFQQTGSIYAYGRYKGADQLLREHQAQKQGGQELDR